MEMGLEFWVGLISGVVTAIGVAFVTVVIFLTATEPDYDEE